MTAPAAALALRRRAEEAGGTLPPLLVQAERVAASAAQGVHGRRRVGQGETFWQHRRYQPGDAATRVDWRQSARAQALYVRETEWEAAQSVWLWRDGSASMDWRSELAPETKRARADLLAAALAALLLRAGERVGLLGDATPPGATRATLARLAVALTRPPAADALPPPLPLPRHARVVLMSDFLDPVDQLRPRLEAIAARGVRGHLLQILDPAEWSLPYRGRIRFEGLENEGGLMVRRVEALRPDYEAAMRLQVDAVRETARALGWTASLHHVDRPARAALVDLWAALGGLGHR